MGQRFLTNDALLPETDPRHGKELAPFLGRVLTMMVGFACVLGAAQWTRKLLKREDASEQKRNFAFLSLYTLVTSANFCFISA